MSDITFRDNSDEILRLLAAAKARALERCGMLAEGYAADLCPVDTGSLRNSISHKCDEDTAYLGSNVEYAAYVLCTSTRPTRPSVGTHL